jgi:ankyrin repeat protein
VVVQILLKTGKFDVVRWPKVVVRLLLLVTGKAYIDTKDWKGQTPLSYTAENGHAAVVQRLLDRTEVADDEGWTPLLWAFVQQLLDRGARTE